MPPKKSKVERAATLHVPVKGKPKHFASLGNLLDKHVKESASTSVRWYDEALRKLSAAFTMTPQDYQTAEQAAQYASADRQYQSARTVLALSLLQESGPQLFAGDNSQEWVKAVQQADQVLGRYGVTPTSPVPPPELAQQYQTAVANLENHAASLGMTSLASMLHQTRDGTYARRFQKAAVKQLQRPDISQEARSDVVSNLAAIVAGRSGLGSTLAGGAPLAAAVTDDTIAQVDPKFGAEMRHAVAQGLRKTNEFMLSSLAADPSLTPEQKKPVVSQLNNQLVALEDNEASQLTQLATEATKVSNLDDPTLSHLALAGTDFSRRTIERWASAQTPGIAAVMSLVPAMIRHAGSDGGSAATAQVAADVASVFANYKINSMLNSRMYPRATGAPGIPAAPAATAGGRIARGLRGALKGVGRLAKGVNPAAAAAVEAAAPTVQAGAHDTFLGLIDPELAKQFQEQEGYRMAQGRTNPLAFITDPRRVSSAIGDAHSQIGELFGLGPTDAAAARQRGRTQALAEQAQQDQINSAEGLAAKSLLRGTGLEKSDAAIFSMTNQRSSYADEGQYTAAYIANLQRAQERFPKAHPVMLRRIALGWTEAGDQLPADAAAQVGENVVAQSDASIGARLKAPPVQQVVQDYHDVMRQPYEAAAQKRRQVRQEELAARERAATEKQQVDVATRGANEAYQAQNKADAQRHADSVAKQRQQIYGTSGGPDEAFWAKREREKDQRLRALRPQAGPAPEAGSYAQAGQSALRRMLPVPSQPVVAKVPGGQAKEASDLLSALRHGKTRLSDTNQRVQG